MRIDTDLFGKIMVVVGIVIFFGIGIGFFTELGPLTIGVSAGEYEVGISAGGFFVGVMLTAVGLAVIIEEPSLRLPSLGGWFTIVALVGIAVTTVGVIALMVNEVGGVYLLGNPIFYGRPRDVGVGVLLDRPLVWLGEPLVQIGFVLLVAGLALKILYEYF